ncbi:MAG: hypothetical protein VB857_17995, partial [Pirellulaceae bacterium]
PGLHVKGDSIKHRFRTKMLNHGMDRKYDHDKSLRVNQHHRWASSHQVPDRATPGRTIVTVDQSDDRSNRQLGWQRCYNEQLVSQQLRPL